jgi:membrane protease YdiL (CAAX protease family)
MNDELRLAMMRTIPFLIVIFLAMILLRRQKINRQDLDLVKPVSLSRYTVWVIGFLLLALSIEFVLAKLGILEVSVWNHTLVPSIIRIIGAVILAPIAEEFIFRGMILNVLIRKTMRLHLAVLLQAGFFVLLHHFAYEHTLSSTIGIVQSFMDAMLFAYARMYTKSLYTPITMHATGNAIAILERFVL